MPLCSSPSRRPPHQVHVAAVLRLPRQPPDPVLRPGAHPRPIARTTLRPTLLGPTRELLLLLHDATIGRGTEAPSAELPRVRPSGPGGGGGVLHGTAGAVRELADLLRHMVSGKMCGGLEWRRTTRGSRQTKTRGNAGTGLTMGADIPCSQFHKDLLAAAVWQRSVFVARSLPSTAASHPYAFQQQH